jgi:hypothetical protein
MGENSQAWHNTCFREVHEEAKGFLPETAVSNPGREVSRMFAPEVILAFWIAIALGRAGW